MAKKRKSSFPMIVSTATALVVLLVTFIFAAFDARLHVTEYEVRDARIESDVRLVFLSDLHRSRYGEDEKELIDTVDTLKPDAVLLGGDIFDELDDYEIAQELLWALGEKYPCYFVSGNHEYGETTDEQIARFQSILEDAGIEFLSCEKRTLTARGTTVDIYGIDNEMRYIAYREDDPIGASDRNFYSDLEELGKNVDPDRYSLLLCHAPEAEKFKETSFDLVLSGHTHGGQWRFPPLVNGIYAPGQGIFPRYAYGRYALSDKTTLIVGAGLCTSYTLPRVFNRPEIVLVTLKGEEK